MKHTLTIIALAATAFTGGAGERTAGITRVYDYRPAPGQFVNVLPEIAPDAAPEQVCEAVLSQIGGEEPDGMISLGAFGGYVIFGFDHPLVNVPGEYDFKIAGNAFVDNKEPNGGSCEPGIVMVSVDANGNGLPDDPWYELAGSAYAESYKDFSITYTKPATSDTTYPYTTNDPARPTGEVERNIFHKQSYWPEWTGTETLLFSGTCLPDNGVNTATPPQQNWVLKAFEWGYADNLANSTDPGLKLDWAVDSVGRPVTLRQVDFIKVYTGVCQSCGRIGETSTEVAGARDLHPDAEPVSGLNGIFTENTSAITLLRSESGALNVRASLETAYAIYTVSGRRIMNGRLTQGDNRIATAALPSGIYILQTPGATHKFRR